METNLIFYSCSIAEDTIYHFYPFNFFLCSLFFHLDFLKYDGNFASLFHKISDSITKKISPKGISFNFVCIILQSNCTEKMWLYHRIMRLLFKLTWFSIVFFMGEWTPKSQIRLKTWTNFFINQRRESIAYSHNFTTWDLKSKGLLKSIPHAKELNLRSMHYSSTPSYLI